MKHKAILSVCLLSLFLASCSFSESKKTTQQIDYEIKVEIPGELPVSKEIASYPVVFSYATEELKTELNAKAIKLLTKQEKLQHLSLEGVPTEVTDEDFRVFAVNKITYEKATLIIYLVKEIQTESSHERDQLVLVIYNKEGKARNVLSKNLQDVFSTREFKFMSPKEFTIVDTDSEYSVDPESEAEDIKNGREPEPSIMTFYYMVDPVKMKFKQVNWLMPKN